MNTQSSALLLKMFMVKCVQLEQLRNWEALVDLDRLVAAQLPATVLPLWGRWRTPQARDDRARIMARVDELIAGARTEQLTPIHGSEGL